jgi:predicted thioredoxin/glutaredoxin
VKAELDTMLSSLIEKRDRLNRMISGIQVLKSVQERQQEEGQSDYDMQAVYQIPDSLVENMWNLFDKAYESDPDDESQRVLLPAFITMAVSSLQTNRNPSSKLMQNSVREIYDHTEQNFRVIIERMKSEQPELKDIDLKWSDMFLSYLEGMFNQKGFRRLFRFLPKNTREYMMDAARIFLDTGLHAS